MPHWGIAWAVGPNYNLDVDDPRARQAFEEIEKAKALAASGPPQERAYVEALAVRYSPDPKADRAALARKYSAAMRVLSQSYPDDLDAATLYAESLMNLKPWKLWTLDGKPADGTLEILGILESVLRRDPNHIGSESLLHPLGRSVDRPGARAGERQAARNARPGVRTSGPHARAHLRAHRRSEPARRWPTWPAPTPTACISRTHQPTASTASPTTRTTCTSSPTPR